MDVNIGIAESNRNRVADILNTLLSDEYVLYTQTRNFHWNVAGVHFAELHKFFESQYEELNDIVDDVAERVRQLGLMSCGSLKEFSEKTGLTESSGSQRSSHEMITLLLDSHETIIQRLRKEIPIAGDDCKDVGNEDFLTSVLQKHEKMSWMLRAHIQE